MSIGILIIIHFSIDMQTERIKKMTKLAKRYHAGQYRNNGKVPQWHHCVSVAEILEFALNASQEITEIDKETLLLAALGHDLYEDTDIELSIIRDQFGEQVDLYISLLTNKLGNEHWKEYIPALASLPEEAALIKLADLNDNVMSCAYGAHDLGVAWLRDFFIPLSIETERILKEVNFTHYPKTAADLFSRLRFAQERLMQNVDKFDTKDKEPFDITILRTMYDLTDIYGKPWEDAQIAPGLKEQYERHKEIKTLKEFARFLVEIDAYSVN